MRQWSKSTLYLAVALVTAGFGLIFLAWNGAAEKDFIQGQFPYLLSGGLSGLALVLCGLAAAVTQSFRKDILTLQDRLEELLGDRAGAPASLAPVLAAVPDTEGVFVATSNLYHRPSCRTIQGRGGLDLIGADEADSRGLGQCRVCQPGARTA